MVVSPGFSRRLIEPPYGSKALLEGGVDIVAELQKLAALKDAGVLSDAEFAAAKAKLLG